MQLIVIGGGAAGVLVAAAASRQDRIDEIVVVDPGSRPGPGLAYGAAAPHHLLNSPAGRMGAWVDAPDDFVRWSRTTGRPQGEAEFSPRRLYGDYLEAVLAGLPRTTVRRATAVDLVAGPTDVRVALGDGDVIRGDAAVLAIGNPPPPGRGTDAPAGALIPDPWAPGALERVGGRVLLIGTGLTMVDVATTLARADPATTITATSRHGLLPRAHADGPVTAGDGLGEPPTQLGDLVHAVRRRIDAASAADRPWQGEVDGLRPQIDRLWAALPHQDRQRFVRHVSRYWEVHRHRMSPAVAEELRGLTGSGRLTIGEPTGSYDAVVDCTGARRFASGGWSPLVDSLLASGAARADPLGMGLDVDDLGRVRAGSGAPVPRLFAIGLARRGSQWETTAIPEIRQQAANIAAAVADSS